jgi:rfaE bifunctional protein kinase chain/domain
LRIAIVGDFCLDRYLEIDPAKSEISIETGLPVHNVVNVRSQAGAAGTILNNLVALGVGTIHPVGFTGIDGEGFELLRVLDSKPGVQMKSMMRTPHRSTFTYCKPLILSPGKPPVELNRLDTKNWTPTPAVLQGQLIDALRELAHGVDALIVMDQVDVPETGVVTARMLEEIGGIAKANPEMIVLADSRRGLGNYPPVSFKMNRAEFSSMNGLPADAPLDQLMDKALTLATKRCRNVFITLAEHGIIGATSGGEVEHVPSFPTYGPIDVVGAGDSVTANLTTALMAGANLQQALKIAMAAASIVVHQLGTTGTANPAQIAENIERDLGSPKIPG